MSEVALETLSGPVMGMKDNDCPLTPEQAWDLLEDSPALPEDKSEYKEWKELREFVRRVKCVVCQHIGDLDSQGNPIGQIDYTPELIRVSHQHHEQTRGAGGPDAENLVSLCPTHHDEFHDMGQATFQLHYHIDLKAHAKIVFEKFKQGIRETEYALRAKANHEQVSSRLHQLKTDVHEIGAMLLEIRDSDIGGKRPYMWLNFNRFQDYVSAPIASGGLGISARSAWRYQNFAKLIRDYPAHEDDIMKMGVLKANAIIDIVGKAESTEVRDDIFSRASSASMSDLIEWKSKTYDGFDPRQDRLEKVCKLLEEILVEAEAVIIEPGFIEAKAWALMRTVDPKRFSQEA